MTVFVRYQSTFNDTVYHFTWFWQVFVEEKYCTKLLLTCPDSATIKCTPMVKKTGVERGSKQEN